MKIKFWEKKDKKVKKSKKNKSATGIDIKADKETDDNKETSETPTTELLDEKKDDGIVEAENNGDKDPAEDDDKPKETKPGKDKSKSKTNEHAKHKKLAKKILPVDYTKEGVFLFGSKIEGKFSKVLFSLFAIILLPPTFLFGIALLVCVFMLLYPLIAFIAFAIFPTVVLSLFILMALLPVLFPLAIIFLLITGKGKMSIYSEGKFLLLKLFNWNLPSI